MFKFCVSLMFTGFYFAFGAIAVQAIHHPLPYTEGFELVWSGFLLGVFGAWVFTLHQIWEKE